MLNKIMVKYMCKKRDSPSHFIFYFVIGLDSS